MTEAQTETTGSSSKMLRNHRLQILTEGQLRELLTTLTKVVESPIRRATSNRLSVMIEIDSARPTGPLDPSNPKLWQERAFNLSDTGLAAAENMLRNYAAQRPDHRPHPGDRWVKVVSQTLQ